MNNMQVRQSGRLSFTITRADSEAVSATVIFTKGIDTFSDTVLYDSDGVAFFEFGSPDTDILGVYEYQVNENFATGSPDIYPNMDDCDGDCDLPTLEICRSLNEGS